MITNDHILEGRILIVDDKEANVLLLVRMLRAAGYVNVSSTTHPEEVCERYLKTRYDLILLDLEMPRMDGFQVMENLKEIETEGYLPVLVITAQPEHKLRALRSGARDFVSKPFDLAEVLLRVHNLLEVRLLHSETQRLNQLLETEREVSDRLIQNVLPLSVADRLRHRQTVMDAGPVEVVTESYAEVTALFADVMEFTRFAEGTSAVVLVGVLEDIVRRLGEDGEDQGRRDLAALEDAYIAAAGLPDALADASVQAGHLAVDMARALEQFNRRSRYKLRIRVGLDTVGPAEGGPADGVPAQRALTFDL